MLVPNQAGFLSGEQNLVKRKRSSVIVRGNRREDGQRHNSRHQGRIGHRLDDWKCVIE